MDPMTMMMIAQGAVKAGQSGSRLLKPKFGSTAYGRLLNQRRTQGNLTPGQESLALGRTAETATKQANLANKRYMGSMINKGLQGSVSAQRGLREAEADVRRTVADTGKDIYQSEEKAKSQAKLDYARAMDQDKAERRQALIGTVGAIGETALKAGATEYGARVGKQQAQDQAYTDAMKKYGYAKAFQTPSGETRYQGGGFDPQTGEARGPLTLDDKRAVEVYAQKAGVKNSSGVQTALAGLMNEEITINDFEKLLTKEGWDEQKIDEFITYLIGS
jgi:hypothetical protein